MRKYGDDAYYSDSEKFMNGMVQPGREYSSKPRPIYKPLIIYKPENSNKSNKHKSTYKPRASNKSKYNTYNKSKNKTYMSPDDITDVNATVYDHNTLGVITSSESDKYRRNKPKPAYKPVSKWKKCPYCGKTYDANRYESCPFCYMSNKVKCPTCGKKYNKFKYKACPYCDKDSNENVVSNSSAIIGFCLVVGVVLIILLMLIFNLI